FTTTVAPSRASLSAMARPIPREAPVTIATFPVSELIVFCSFLLVALDGKQRFRTTKRSDRNAPSNRRRSHATLVKLFGLFSSALSLGDRLGTQAVFLVCRLSCPTSHHSAATDTPTTPRTEDQKARKTARIMVPAPVSTGG